MGRRAANSGVGRRTGEWCRVWGGGQPTWCCILTFILSGTAGVYVL